MLSGLATDCFWVTKSFHFHYWIINSHFKYPQADVRIAPPTVPGRDEPYTRQFTECEEKAEYIYFTPDFVLGKKLNEYGPAGKRLG
jgi:hypothetical protein